MIRALVVLLLAGAARADDMLVRVTDGRKPVGDAAVKVLRAGEEIVFDAGAFAPDAMTTERGDAVVAAPADGTILVYLPGYALAVAPADSRIVDVELRPERIFWGTVANDQGKPVAGATVELRTTFNRKATFLARSRDDGRFFVYGLWLDYMSVRIGAPGLLPAEAGDLLEDDRGNEYRLTRAATVRGAVRDDLGEPLPEVEVRARHGARAWTAADGTFEIAGLPPDDTCVLFVLGEYGGRSPVFGLEPGEVRGDLLIVAFRPATARLRVLDQEGKPLAAIAAEPMGLRSDEAGVMRLTVPAQEATPITVGAPGLVTAEVVVPALSPGAHRDLGDLVLLPEPVVDVWVRLPAGTPAPEGTVDGVPLVDGVARIEGERDAEVRVPGYPLVGVRVVAPGPVDLVLPELLWLEGIVLDPRGAPAPGVAVSVQEPDGDQSLTTTTDPEGRFRVGPLVEAGDSARLFRIRAEAGTTSADSEIEIAGEGLLELQLEERDLDVLRGTVVRGDRPVRRFEVEGEDFLNEAGRFEILVSRAAKDWVEVGVEGRSFVFRLPPPGEPLVARLPAGALAVRPEDGRPGREVRLKSAGLGRASGQTGDDGIARFADLRPGVYVAEADGFLAAEVTVDEGTPALVALPAAPAGAIRFRWRGEERVLAVPPGASGVSVTEGPVAVGLRRITVRAGSETSVDLDTPDAGVLVVTGASGPFWLERSTESAVVTWRCLPTDDPVVLEALPPGEYVLHTPLESLRVSIGPGTRNEIDLRSEEVPVTGRVVSRSGKPVQAAVVHIDAGLFGAWARTDLSGTFRCDVPAGDYRVLIDHDAYAPLLARVVVRPSGVEGDATFVLEPSRRGNASVLGPGGEPVAGVDFRVDGIEQSTDGLGRLRLQTEPAIVDFDLEGFAAIRGLAVRDGDVIRLQRGASVTILCDAEANDRVRLRVGGREWERAPGVLYPLDPAGRIERADLPVGPAEIVLLPREEGEEPFRVPLTLLPGGRVQVDLRGR